MPGYELIGEEEKKATQKIFDEGGILFHRAFEDIRKKFYVNEFNNECENYFRNKNCSAVSSGTAAVKCALKAIGIKAGDEVITQAFNFVACVEAIVDVGAKPIICNVDKNLHIDVEDLQRRVTSNTKAILVVHMLGLGGPIDELKEFCQQNNIRLLEDACEAIGGSYAGEYYGSIGDIGSHAFNLADFITGAKLTELCADISNFVEGRKNDDNAHVLLRYENGVKGMLWSSQVAPGNENALKIRIYGDKGGLEWEQENPNYLRVDIFGEAKKIIRRAGNETTDVAGRVTRIPPGHPEGYLEGFANIYSDFAKQIHAIKNNQKIEDELLLVPSIEDGLKGVKFISADVESGLGGSKWLKF